MARYFSAVAYAGRLYVGGILDRGPWDSCGLTYWDESQVDKIFEPRVGDRKKRTADELRAAVEASRLRHPSVKLWILQGLEDEAREVWQANGN